MNRSSALAEAVKDVLNATDFDLKFTATRNYQVPYTLKQLKTLRVTVIAPVVEQQAISRIGNVDVINVHIVINRQINPADIDAIDILADFTEKVAEHFRGTRVKRWAWLETKVVIPYDSESLTQWRVFMSVIELQYQIAWK